MYLREIFLGEGRGLHSFGLGYEPGVESSGHSNNSFFSKKCLEFFEGLIIAWYLKVDSAPWS
jgi:hypothetical protein